MVTAYANNNVTAYSYHFNVLPAGLAGVTGATHYQEVAWVFNNIDGNGYATDPFNASLVDRPAYVQVSTLMSRMWASFVSDLNPNNHVLTGYPVWPAYNTSRQGVGENFVFDAEVTSYAELDDWRVGGILLQTELAKTRWKHLKITLILLLNITLKLFLFTYSDHCSILLITCFEPVKDHV